MRLVLQRAMIVPCSWIPKQCCEARTQFYQELSTSLGEFKVDLATFAIDRNMRCGLCRNDLPPLHGFMIIGGQYDGFYIEANLIELAEDPVEVIDVN